ncbi:sigma-70 family RNA polymerase sigma factor [Patescibacteria group bacterium]|nr:sigma-70 family RNA polymerase sigma factor [Patescibacteria group bacterium]MBU1921647.1 sigma-70 family RNA polymerase sigma factor [Patescibacteria group bacterium]
MQSKYRIPLGFAQNRIMRAYFKEIDFERMEDEETVELIKRIQKHNKRSDITTLCEKFQPVVIDWAKRFRFRGVPLLDLIQEGNIGLLKAIDKYQWTFKVKFGTYAGYWIRAEMLRLIYQHAALGIFNPSIARDKSRVIQAKRHIARYRQHEATLEDIAELANLSLNRVKHCESLQKEIMVPLVFSSELTRYRHGLMEEEIIDHAAVKPDKKILLQEMIEQTSEVKKYFKKRDIEILYQNCVLGYELSEIGLEFGISRERVRQIRNKVQNGIRFMLLMPDLRHRVSPRDRDIFLHTSCMEKSVTSVMAKYNLTRKQVADIGRSVGRQLKHLSDVDLC